MPGSKNYFLIVIILAVFFSFWKLGAGDLNEWDESEYGQNAIEMSRTGDFVNYTYAGKPDTWNAKPPLSVWLIVLAYKIFGYNAFALRFFSAIAAILFFIFAYKLVRLYSNEKTALICCLVLLTCKAIIGFHVGRTGDADALLVLFLTAFLYYFLLFIDFNKKNAIIHAAIFAGIAFYTKGTAAFLMIPGIVLYLIATKKLRSTLLAKQLWIGIAFTFLIISSWVVILLIKGKVYESDSIYGSKNVLETLFIHDTVNRLTDSNFREASTDRLIFIRYLDVRLNLWNYFFYLSVLIGGITVFRRKEISDSLLILSICISIPVILLLTFSASKHEWYLAPVALFLAIIITKGIIFISEKYKWFNAIWIGVLIFTLVRQVIELSYPKRDTIEYIELHKHQFDSKDTLQLLHIPSQDYFLYLNWYGKFVTIDEKPDYRKNKLLFLDKRYNFLDSMKSTVISCSGNYCFAVSR